MRHPWTSRPRTLAAVFAVAVALIATLFGGTTVAQAASVTQRANAAPTPTSAQATTTAQGTTPAPATTTAQGARVATSPNAAAPCDIYAAGGTPCVAAHSSTRALYASYSGPLYQVTRLSDHAAKNIGVLERGGYADATEQDRFCAGTTCLVTKLYDQSPMHNDLTQPPRGGFSGPAMGGYDNLPIADMAPITVDGHKAYGIFIAPGMGLRDNDTRGVAVDDEPEGMYWIVDGQHYNGGCCFDYGNGEIDSRDDDNGTMETSYFGTASAWYHGNPPGPWIMTDQENNLVGCVNPGSTSKLCPNLPSITSRFVTAVAKGEPHHWASLGGDAQQGALTTMFDGPRVDASYDPMRKQGAIVLGNGGDNSVGSQGTFYEGVMTAGYPSDAVDQQVQANIVAAKYDVRQLSLAPTAAGVHPPGLQTFAPGETQGVVESYRNSTGAAVANVELRLSAPTGWKVKATGPTRFSSVAPGQSVSTTFAVTSSAKAFNGDIAGRAEARGKRIETTAEKVRNDSPIKINEFRAGTGGNATDSYVELYNAGDRSVDLSGWTLTEHPTQQAVFSTVTIPAGTRIAAHDQYLLALSNSALAAPTAAGARTLNVRSTAGMNVGDQVTIDTGGKAETATIADIAAGAASGPRVAGRLGNAVKLNGSDEYVNLPAGIVGGLSDYTVSAWVNPASDDTWARVFDFGRGTAVNMFMTVNGGGAGLRFGTTTNGNGAEQDLTGGGHLPLNTWSHVAMTLSGTTGTLYLNGTPVATSANMTLNPSALGATNQNWIGRSQYPDPFLNGTVDDFNIYDHALSPAEVAALAGGQPGAGNVGHYAFDETGGGTATDSSGAGHHATIVSAGSAATANTPLWQPLPDGPLTVPARSTNVPVTSIAGFTVGQKMAIGYGDKLEVATVTAVGKAGLQARLAAPAPAGATTLKVTSTSNISVGDTIRLDIDRKIETVTVTAVGTSGANGTGLALASPLKAGHSSNLPFSDRGTGITFTPATRYAHASNEPVQALGGGIVLDKPLTHNHNINVPVRDGAVTTAGYQETTAPDQWFGGPALSGGAGSMVVRDQRGHVTDSLNYGLLVDPWAAEGYQGGTGSGCTVATPAAGRSASRFPDGNDTDSNCADFITSNATPGASNLFALSPGPRVSLGLAGAYLKHNATDDLVVTAPVTAASPATGKQDATWVQAAGLANPSCVSFESVNRPGSYLRHANFQFHLQPNDGSSLFAQDATFCPQTGNSGQGTSYQSVNFAGRFIRAFDNAVYLAGNGGANPWDTTTSWAADTSWVVAPPWAP
ncbi:alpha-N-arabinofuranosidase [Actinoplanes sp. TBRC 11911]|uniref:arabinofuranosidase catalytic domain-containing protein n=1 Tax=Actinoplanes sp. TBRC 11911 TaxID=2729386 RepID=UPI00145C7CC0|nr:arabinofuranosidase catalytic domain-containing protein [Actinoplanes sp. TBRC 11911]NMO53803.1 alpha-N-arabinofuranosidase [Actinoplanes sp. TBRC 11911]